MAKDASPVIWFEELRRNDVPRVGGKNASLGEMVRNLEKRGVRVPTGFATTADAYWCFIADNGLKETITSTLAELASGKARLAEVGMVIRRAILRGEWNAEMLQAIAAAYAELCRRAGKQEIDVSVRSSAASGRPGGGAPTRYEGGQRHGFRPCLAEVPTWRCHKVLCHCSN
nr:Phosphoenolpyruvate synthase [Methylocystis sp. SC2]